ncbi:MAG: thiamine pyrophosphate-binding protein [Betaproteobacteria bacterium]|nr:MAG: thiamine pyrophosphate-binding protein [Betaproteobacteria bacterium]
MIGAELMARAIERQGVRTVFGLPGHLESFFGALQDRNLRLIHMRHESAVVLAADGYARARRGIGVACVTAGPGLANALGGLAAVYEACVPLLLICGRNPAYLAETAALQELDHPRAARPFTKWAQTVHDPSRLGEYIDMACRVALAGRPGPVLLDVPRDLAEAKVDAAIAAESLAPLVRVPRALADPAAIQRAADLLEQAKRPLVVAGSGAYWGAAGAGLRTLAHEHRMPVVAKSPARGLVSEDGRIGFSWPIANLGTRAADVVLVAGARLGSPISYAAPPYFDEHARFIQVDIDAAEIGRSRRIEVPVAGDCGPALEAIARELLERRYAPRDPGWLGAALAERMARIDAAGRDEDGLVHPLRMARELAARMPAGSIFVGDGANCLNWYKGILQVREPGLWMDHEPFGSMGVGLPFAIGAMAAEQESAAPRPVFLGTGDGALGQYVAELSSAALHRLPIFIMLANDASWGASREIALRLFGGTYGTDLVHSRYDLVARGLDCHGELARTPAEVGPAFERALAAVRAGKPALVNVLVDRESSGALRREPLLQMVPFNEAWHAARCRIPGH